MSYEKPLPNPDPNTEPWFAALKEHQLLLQYFPSADHYQYPYSDRCTEDWSTEWEWRPSRGEGEVYTWVRMHQLYHPSWKESIPTPWPSSNWTRARACRPRWSTSIPTRFALECASKSTSTTSPTTTPCPSSNLLIEAPFAPGEPGRSAKLLPIRHISTEEDSYGRKPADE